MTDYDVAVSATPLCVSCFDAVLNADVIDAETKRWFARRKRNA
jgi:hypothetical protein